MEQFRQFRRYHGNYGVKIYSSITSEWIGIFRYRNVGLIENTDDYQTVVTEFKVKQEILVNDKTHKQYMTIIYTDLTNCTVSS